MEDLEDLEIIKVIKKIGLPPLNESSINNSELKKKSMADFSGILSESNYQLLKEHADQTRKEWERNT